MKNTFTSIAFLFICNLLAAQNLILNGSCDSALVTGQIPNWQEVTGTDWGQRVTDPLPFSGPFYFFPGVAATAELKQEINLSSYASAIDSGVEKFHFRGYVRSFDQSPADDCSFLISFDDTGTVPLKTFTFGPYANRTAWQLVDSLLSPPVGTRKVTVLLRSIRQSGSNNDGYYDELSLTPQLVCQPYQVNITATDTAFCQGDSAIICAPVGYQQYVWSNGDTTTCILVKTAGPYSVTVVDINGCTASSNTVNINVYPSPVPVIIASDTIICPNDSTRLCVTPAFSGYQWNNGKSDSCIFAGFGNYRVTVTDANGCSAQSGQQEIKVYQMPAIDCIVVVDDTLAALGTVSRQWYRNGQLLPGDTGTIYVVTQPGSYTVEAVEVQGCHIRCGPVVFTGLQELGKVVDVNVNVSATGNLSLQVSEALVGSTVSVYDAQGRMLLQSPIRNPKSEFTLHAAKGIYFLHVSSDRGCVVRKMVW